MENWPSFAFALKTEKMGSTKSFDIDIWFWRVVSSTCLRYVCNAIFIESSSIGDGFRCKIDHSLARPEIICSPSSSLKIESVSGSGGSKSPDP
jgi:hypothetical protein